MDLSRELESAVRSAEIAGAALRDAFRAKGVPARSKERRQEVVTEADLGAERLVLEHLRTAWPGDAILAEESGGPTSAPGRLWCVDPLDGTANFAGGVPHWAVAIALLLDGEPVLAVTHDPLRGELTAATLTEPTRTSGLLVGVRPTVSVEDALVADNRPFEQRDPTHALERRLRAARGRRETGSMALDLAWVAHGRFDATTYRRSDRLWDYVGGELLVRMAGGEVRPVAGHPDTVVAASTTLAAALCASDNGGVEPLGRKR